MILGQLSMFYIIVCIISALLLPIMLWMFYTSFRVKTVFFRYNLVLSESGLTTTQAIQKVLDEKGMNDVKIQECPGNLTDHFDPRNNTIFLSQSSAHSSSVAALGVAMHELGHAMQYAENYAPVKIRTALVPTVNFLSKLSFPLILFSVILECFSYTAVAQKFSNFFLILAIICYTAFTILTLITLPTEFNASRRAKKMLLESNICNENEVHDVSIVLHAAASTYVASFALSLAQLARLIFILLSRRKRN